MFSSSFTFHKEDVKIPPFQLPGDKDTRTRVHVPPRTFQTMGRSTHLQRLLTNIFTVVMYCCPVLVFLQGMCDDSTLKAHLRMHFTLPRGSNYRVRSGNDADEDITIEVTYRGNDRSYGYKFSGNHVSPPGSSIFASYHPIMTFTGTFMNLEEFSGTFHKKVSSWISYQPSETASQPDHISIPTTVPAPSLALDDASAVHQDIITLTIMKSIETQTDDPEWDLLEAGEVAATPTPMPALRRSSPGLAMSPPPITPPVLAIADSVQVPLATPACPEPVLTAPSATSPLSVAISQLEYSHPHASDDDYDDGDSDGKHYLKHYLEHGGINGISAINMRLADKISRVLRRLYAGFSKSPGKGYFRDASSFDFSLIYFDYTFPAPYNRKEISVEVTYSDPDKRGRGTTTVSFGANKTGDGGYMRSYRDSRHLVNNLFTFCAAALAATGFFRIMDKAESPADTR